MTGYDPLPARRWRGGDLKVPIVMGPSAPFAGPFEAESLYRSIGVRRRGCRET